MCQDDLRFKAERYAFKPTGNESLSDARSIIMDEITKSSMPVRQIKGDYLQGNKALCNMT